MSRNKLFLILIVILIIGAIGIGVYFYFFTDTFGGAGGGKTSSVGNFLPFGNSSGNTETSRNESAPTLNKPVDKSNQPVARLLKLVQNPVAGFIPTALGSTTVVRYMEKETGHIFDIDMSIPLAKTRITNTTVPRVHEALFGQNGSSVLVRYLDKNNSIQTYSAIIPVATSSGASLGGVALRGAFLPENIGNISMSPSKSKIFTVVNFGNSSVGTVSGLDGKNKSQIFDSPFTEWLPSWTNDKTILLTTKPSSIAIGFAYTLDAKSGSFKKIYGGTSGLTALLSPDSKNLLVSEVDSDSPSLKIYRALDHNLTDTGLKTIADKCLWAGNTIVYCAIPETTPAVSGGYPDAWYQGIVLFSDSIWKIDLETFVTDLVFGVSQNAGENIDAINLSQNKNGDYLFFINKRDSSLWSLKLQ